jgi:hypothetical protein
LRKRKALGYLPVALIVSTIFLHREVEITAMTVAWATKYLAIQGILSWDERRLPPQQLARAWPPATRLVCAVYFQELGLPIHFFRTRRSVWGVLLGLLASAGVVFLAGLTVEATLLLLGLPT